MKKIFYLAVCAFVSFTISAQSLWNDGFGNFENWEVFSGETQPKGWYGSNNSGYAKVHMSPIADRFGEANKACKITSEYTGDTNNSYTWHLSARTVDNASKGTLNLLNISTGTSFYYTFWARADVDDLKMYIGCEQQYNPGTGGAGWATMPYVELTTKWKQYGIFVDAAITDLNYLAIQLRGNKTFYIDDIVLEAGDALPALSTEEYDYVVEETLWNAGFDGTFDIWSSGLPAGWTTIKYSSSTMSVSAVEDRNETADKACKVSVNNAAGWLTWHTSLRNPGTTALSIPNETDFYYTFWAKSNIEGKKMYASTPEMYDAAANGGTAVWANAPYVELTTEWKQYGVLQKANYALTHFAFHFREAGSVEYYLDDLEIKAGTELPPLNQDSGNATGIFELASELNPISIISTQSGIAFSSLQGEASIYDSFGRLVLQKTVAEGVNYFPLNGTGLHIVKFSYQGKTSAIKTIVQ